MKTFKTCTSKAFSLIELSIVGLVISILIAGIVQSRVMVKKAKLANARTATVNSPVMSMGDLVLWYETTLEKSFGDLNVKDGVAVETWYDLNPDIETVRNNAFLDETHTYANNPPTYKINAISGLPALSFDGIDDSFGFNGDGIVKSDYTIFVVEQRGPDAITSSNYSLFIGGNPKSYSGSPSGHSSVLGLGYLSHTKMTVAYYYAASNSNCAPYSEQTPLIHSYTYNFNETKQYTNGTDTLLAQEHNYSGMINQVNIFNNAAIGKYTNRYYQGNIGEVIIFKKYLKKEDRKSIERYLGEKWGIEVAED